MDSPDGSITSTPDSSSSDGCMICFHTVQNDQPFGKIDHDQECNVYHPDCLDKWFNEHDIGIITRRQVPSYSIYHENTLVETVPITPISHEVISPILLYNNVPGYSDMRPYGTNDNLLDIEAQQVRVNTRTRDSEPAICCGICCVMAFLILMIVAAVSMA